MKRAAGTCAVVLAVLAGVFWTKVMHFLGWDGQASDYYAAWSSSVPALITLLGMSTVLTAMVGKFNCHERGCWRVGKHHVSGTPWCSRHHGSARPERTEHEILTSIEASLAELASLLRESREPA
jgi:hypothetical protein